MNTIMQHPLATHQNGLFKQRGRHFSHLGHCYSGSGTGTGTGTASATIRFSPSRWSSVHKALIGSRSSGCIVSSPLSWHRSALPLFLPSVSIDIGQRQAYKPRMSSSMEGSADLPPEPRPKMLHIFGGVVAFALFLSVAKMALTADPSASLTPSLVRHSQVALAAFKQKAPQVLGVFRDHGLLLSLLLALSAFFSMAETSITTLWPWKVRELAEKEAQGGVFQMLQKDVTRFLTTILIGTTVANIAATALVTEAATTLFGEAGVSAATGVMTVVLLIVTEITPKSIAVHNATEVARIVVRPVAWLSYVLYPVGRVVTMICMGLLKILGLKSDGEPFVTEEELKLMLRGAELSGSIEEEEQDMIENVLEIKDTCVREVMTPLVDVVAIDASDTLMDFRNLWVLHQYSRVPVFEKRVDNIVGVAYAMDMLDYVDQTEMLKKLSVGRIVHKPAYFVPDSMSVWNLLREFRIRKVHMAIVLNEYGGTIGIVTLEDVVEEIVGEIFDENDSKEEIRRKTGYIVRRADGVLDVDANTSIEDLAEALEVKVPKGPYYYETVSGFVCETFGYIPRTGESIKVIFDKDDLEDPTALRESESDHHHHHHQEVRDKYKNYKLEILAGNARKVGSVRFQEMNGATQQEGGGGEEEKLVTKFVPRALQFRRVDPQNHNRVSGKTGRRVDPVTQAYDQDVPCIVHPDDKLKSRYLISPSSDIDCVIESEATISATIKNGNNDQDFGHGPC